MINYSFTKGEQRIIREISTMQKESIKNCLQQGLSDLPPHLQIIVVESEINLVEYENELLAHDEKCERIIDNPALLFELDKYEISSFRHILFHAREHYDDKLPKSYASLWSKIFAYEELTTLSIAHVN